jgi:hypothetical protein
MMGGALGLAVLVALAESRTDSLRSSGDGALTAVNGGFHAAFLFGAFFVVASALVALLLRAGPAPLAHGADEPMGVPAAAEAD